MTDHDALRAEYTRLIRDCAEARRRGFRSRAASLQRRIDALALRLLEIETGRAA